MGLCVLLVGLGGCNGGATTAEPMSVDSAALGQRDNQSSDQQSNFREEYDRLPENEFVSADTSRLSTFSIDVDTASYSNIRRILKQGELPPPEAVRIEELVNYFRYEPHAPEEDRPLSVLTEIAACPWAPEHHLVRIAIDGQTIEEHQRPAANLVFLIDVSGSMAEYNKLPLIQRSLRLLCEQLREDDRVSIVVYSGASGLVLPPTPGDDIATIDAALERLSAGGSTNGGEGIELAYSTAQQVTATFGDSQKSTSPQTRFAINRVILCSDGDFNVGITDRSELIGLIREYARENIMLTVLGFGTGNLKGSAMEQLADQGNGHYAYVDTLLEARKVLVEQLGGTLMTVAKDVKVQVDFDPRQVQAYRLIGYENRLLNEDDFENDQRDAGELGAGHQVTAFYEVVPKRSHDEQGTTGEAEIALIGNRPTDAATMLAITLRYKLPDAESSETIYTSVCVDDLRSQPSNDFRFASAVAAYGMLLRGSQNAGDASWETVIDTATGALGKDTQGRRTEFVELAKLAALLSQ